MICKSDILTQASGKLGGTTWSHGVSGLQRQAAQSRSNTATNRQMAVRAVFSSLAIAWKSELTEAQRTAWRNYAALSPVTGRLGDKLVLSGSNMFTRTNAIALRAGLSRFDDAPTAPGLSSLGLVQAFGDQGESVFAIGTLGEGQWRLTTGGALLVQSSQFLSLSARNTTPQLRQMMIILGNTAAPPSFTLKTHNDWNQTPGSYAVGTPIDFRFVAVAFDGRITTTQFQTLNIQA